MYFNSNTFMYFHSNSVHSLRSRLNHKTEANEGEWRRMEENRGEWRRMEAELLQRGLPELCNITTKRREHHRVMLWTTGDVMSPQVITAVLAQQVKTWLRIYWRKETFVFTGEPSSDILRPLHRQTRVRMWVENLVRFWCELSQKRHL